MAAKKITGSGLTKLAGMVLGKKPTPKKKTTSKKTKPKVTAIGRTESVSRFESKTSITYTNSSSKNSLKSLQNGLQRLVDSISINSKWNRIGGITADLLEREGKDFVDVSDESESINTNFNVLTNQINVLSNFMIRLDSKFTDLQKNIKTNLVKTTSELAKSQVVVINQVDKQIKRFDENLDKLQSRIDTHDRQLDEIYAESKARQKQEQAKSFLAGKRLPQTAQDHINQIDPGEKHQKVNPGILGSLLSNGELAAEVAAGLYAAKKLGKGAKAGYRAANRATARLGARIAGKLGAKIGARVIPGVGIVLTAKDFYDGYKQDGVWGGVKNAATLGMAYDDDGANTKLDNKSTNENITIVSQGNIILESKKKLTLKAETIVLDAKKIEFTGTIQADSKQKVDTIKSKAQNKGGWFGWGGFPGHDSKVVPNSKPDFLPGPNMGSGRKTSSSGGSLGGGDWNVNPAITGQKSNASIPKPESVLSTALNRGTNSGGGQSFGTLKQQRAKFQKELDNDPELRKTVAALALSEEGQKSSSSQSGVVETMMNRAAAQGKSLRQIVQRHANKEDNYYAPYFDGAFDRNMALLNKNPELAKKVNQSIDNVLNGSNFSNFGTDNSSAHVAASAKKTQTATAMSEAGELYSRKDRAEFSSLHGKKVVQNNKTWYDQTQAAIAKEKKKFTLPGVNQVAAVDDKNRTLIQKSRQKRSDYRPVANSEGPANDFATNRVREANEQLAKSSVTNQRNRPHRMTGKFTLPSGKEFDYVSGGGGKGSLPYGVFDLGNYKTGAQRARDGQISLGRGSSSFDLLNNGKDNMIDPKYGVSRGAFRIHRTFGKGSLGCITFNPKTYQEVEQELLNLKKAGGQYQVVVGSDGNVNVLPKNSQTMAALQQSTKHVESKVSKSVPATVSNKLAFTAEDGLPKGWKDADTVGINPMHAETSGNIEKIRNAKKGLHLYFGGPGDQSYADPSTGYDNKKYLKQMESVGGWEKYLKDNLLKHKPKSFEVDTLDTMADKGVGFIKQQVAWMKEQGLDSKIMLKNVAPEVLKTIMENKDIKGNIGGVIHEATNKAMQSKAENLQKTASGYGLNVIKTGDTHKYQTDAPTPTKTGEAKSIVAPGIQQLSKITKTKQKVAEGKSAPKQVNVAQNGAISGGKPVQPKLVEEKKPEVKVAQKTEKKTEEAPKQSKPEKDYTGFREREETTPYNNTADSIPAGPADNGSGSYKLCLI